MGWNIRRSIGLGKLFRINVSKNGLGFSLGVPGYRISIGSDKKIRKTISIPGTGIYNTQVIGDLSNNNSFKDHQVANKEEHTKKQITWKTIK